MPRFQISRVPGARNFGKKFVIVCEGKTEHDYFEAVRISMRLRTLQVEIANPDVSDPRSIVRKAIDMRSDSSQEGGWIEGDTAWAVFDGEEHFQNAPNNWNDALQIARDNEIKLAISNPSFELWLLLHYQDQFANLNRTKAIRELRKHINRYQKGDILYPDPLGPLTAGAVARAQSLAERILHDELDTHTNPSTGIGELVRLLSELKVR